MTVRIPVAFVDHGSPMVALESSAYTNALRRLVADMPEGVREAMRAVVIVSAHWETRGGVRVSASKAPETIHDFGGFPAELYAMRYAAPGDPTLAAEVAKRLSAAGIEATTDDARGLDHGTWVPLLHVLPDALLPVVQVSLPVPRSRELVHAMGRALAPLADAGVFLVGSGGIVHNIPLFVRGLAARVMPELLAFDAAIRRGVADGDVDTIARYEAIPSASLAVPTTEHFDPLLFALGAAEGRAPTWLHGVTGPKLAMNVIRFD